eukprot:gene3493-6141_t
MEVVKQWEDSAVKGDLGSIEFCAFYFLTGKKSFPKDYSKGYKYSLEGWKLNSPLCTGLLGYCYDKGFGIKKDEVEAFKCFYEGDQLGDIWSRQQLADKYEKRIGDWKEAEKLFLSAISDGDIASLFLLGYLYERGSDDIKMDPKFSGLDCLKNSKKTKVEQNYHLAYKYYKLFSEKCTEDEYNSFKETADDGDAEDQIILGLWYEKGLYVNQDLAQAYKYYKLAKENGSSTGKQLLDNLVSPDEFQKFCHGRIPLDENIIKEGEKLLKGL